MWTYQVFHNWIGRVSFVTWFDEIENKSIRRESFLEALVYAFYLISWV
jgi:hypothetical protein